MFSKRGFTLTEVLIAIFLTGLVVLSATSVDITSRHFFSVINRTSKFQDEAKIAMEHMVRNFVQAHEIYDFGSLEADPFTIGVRIDPNITPANTSDDTWVIYRFVGGASGEIWYYPNAGLAPNTPPWNSFLASSNYEVIATNIYVGSPANPIFTVTNNRIDISIGAGEEQNPDIITNLQTSVVLRSMLAG
jgi:prepilin-type N-terminal cleavage/methylation domain-containing protein